MAFTTLSHSGRSYVTENAKKNYTNSIRPRKGATKMLGARFGAFSALPDFSLFVMGAPVEPPRWEKRKIGGAAGA